MRKLTRVFVFILPLILWVSMSQGWADEWKFDPAHSKIYFDIKHIYSTVRGQFEQFSGHISIDPETHVVTACDMDVAVKSINTDIQQRDNHLRSADFLDEGKYPRMTFKSKTVTHVSDNRYQISGDLTIKDVTKEVTVPFTFLGARDNPMDPKQMVAGYEGKFTLDRLAYHVGSGRFFEMGAVGRDVDVTLTFEVLKDK